MGFLDELKKLTKPYGEDDDYYNDDYDDLDEDEEQEERPARRAATTREDVSASQDTFSAPVASSSGSRVVSMNGSTKQQVVLVRPESYDSAGEIADHLRDHQAVLLNLEQTEKNVSRRLVDFLCGCAYALDGSIKKVATSTYLVTPYGVDITGDVTVGMENNDMYF